MKKMLIALASVAVLSLAAYAADEVKLDGINCFVAGTKPAKAANAVAYKGAKVYFCCMNCPKTFEKDTAKFATKANEQLVATKQAKQTVCPYTGKEIAKDTGVKVGSVEVSFCCMNCKGKTEKATPAEALELVFNDKTFEKGFKVGAK